MRSKKGTEKLLEEKLIENSPVLANNIDFKSQCCGLNVVSSPKLMLKPEAQSDDIRRKSLWVEIRS